MGASNLDQNHALKHACEKLKIYEDTPHFSEELNVGSESVDIFDGAGPVGKSSEEFIKEKIKKNFGFIENPTFKEEERAEIPFAKIE
jgi:hypothetical protein